MASTTKINIHLSYFFKSCNVNNFCIGRVQAAKGLSYIRRSEKLFVKQLIFKIRYKEQTGVILEKKKNKNILGGGQTDLVNISANTGNTSKPQSREKTEQRWILQSLPSLQKSQIKSCLDFANDRVLKKVKREGKGKQVKVIHGKSQIAMSIPVMRCLSRHNAI